jgi:hypothetical protein
VNSDQASPCHWWVPFQFSLSLVGYLLACPVIGGFPSNLPYHWWSTFWPALSLVDTLPISFVTSGVWCDWLLFLSLLQLVLSDGKYDFVLS